MPAALRDLPSNDVVPDGGSSTTELAALVWSIAVEAHREQLDQAGHPYLEHVASVVDGAAALAPASLRIDAAFAATLHDTVEDSGITLDELRRRGVPPQVVEAVDSVTRRQDEDYESLVRRAAANPIGRVVKLADNLNNSDEDRLARLDEATATRLRAKYDSARAILRGEA